MTKEALGEGSTRRAQGGIAAAIDGHDSVEAHLADTLAAGAGLCDPAAAAHICREGPAQVATLLARGVAFDRRDGRLRLAREGAHSAARVVHAGGDATGAHIVAALTAALRADPRIELAEGERALEVLVRDGRVAGLRSMAADGRERVRPARAVALAAGGMGQLYTRTTNPLGATADGPALAARAGAALADLELVQFHPTALALGDGPLSLVSEAVRGEGAILRDAAGAASCPTSTRWPSWARATWWRARSPATPPRSARTSRSTCATSTPTPCAAASPPWPPSAPSTGSTWRATRSRSPRPPTTPSAAPWPTWRGARRSRASSPWASARPPARTGPTGSHRTGSSRPRCSRRARERAAGDLDDWPDGPVAHAVGVPEVTGGERRTRARPADGDVARRRGGARRRRPRPGRARSRPDPRAAAITATDNLLLVARSRRGRRAAHREPRRTSAATTPPPTRARRAASPGSATSRFVPRPPSPGAAGPSPWRPHDHHRLTAPACLLPATGHRGRHEDLWERAWEARRALGSRAVILGHHYQRDEVIAFADVTGDSYLLAQRGPPPPRPS